MSKYRDLLKEATALKRAKKFDEADLSSKDWIDKIKEIIFS